MKTIITQEDLEKAQKETADSNYGNVCNSCLIFQAMKRVGLPVTSVRFTHAIIGGRTVDLHPTCRRVTAALAGNWPTFVGAEIILPDIE